MSSFSPNPLACVMTEPKWYSRDFIQGYLYNAPSCPEVGESRVIEFVQQAALGASDLPFVGMMDREYDYYMISYSPYDSMENRGYPAMLVTGGCATLRCNTGSQKNG